MANLKAALYVRVSTLDQKTGMQTAELRDYAGRMGWSVLEYVEKASSVKKRPALDRLMEDARMKRFDLVMVWKMDRFARSLKQLMDNITALDSFGVRFIALTQGIDTDKQNPGGRLLMQILGAIAEFERSIIVERVVSGVREAQRKGVHCGRPTRIMSLDKAVEMSKSGLGVRAIAAALGVSYRTVARRIASVPKA